MPMSDDRSSVMIKATTTTATTTDDDPAIKVCVRVRPFIKEEIEGQRSGGETQLCIKMPTLTSVELIGRTPEPKSFEFDRCYWSHSEDHPLFADQDTLFEELGRGMLEQALKGYNNCIFAYGQTGSGKSYSVLGGKEPKQQGLLPRIVTGLFEEFEQLDERDEKKCVVSYIEIYNEQIMDLLVAGQPAHAEQQKLEVRNHPTLGTFIPGLTESPVETKESVMKLVDYGATMRHVSATAMNATSSRSHCIFSFKTSITKAFSGQIASSQTHLVDLAGSERAGRTKAEGARLKEGAAINQSLSTLARVISDLAKLSQAKGDKKKGINPPFRDSKITYILKESLSGNSKTVMMAAISPNMLDYEETLSTMKFCQTVKMVQTSAKKNEVNKEGLEAQLRYELQTLREQLEKCEAEKDADQRKLSAVLKNINAQKDLVSKKLTSWDDQLNMEKKRQTHREALIMADDDARRELVRRLTTISQMKGGDKDKESDASSEWDGNENDDDGGISRGYERVQESAKKWEQARANLRKTSKSRGLNIDPQESVDGEDNSLAQEAEKKAKDNYSEVLQDFRGRLQDEMDRLQSLMHEVDERWQYLHGTSRNESIGNVTSGKRTLRSGVIDEVSRSDAFLRLEREAKNIKKAVDAVSDTGAPELKLRVLVVADPSSGDHNVCVQAVSLPTPAKNKIPKDVVQLLTGEDLGSRWSWLEDRCWEMAESKDGTSEELAIEKAAASSSDLAFVSKDGKKYPDPWKEMSISCLRRDLKEVGQQLMSSCSIVNYDNGNAEKREDSKSDASNELKGKADYSYSTPFGIGLGASFDEATCQIDMAQALLQTLKLQRSKESAASLRRKNQRAASQSRSPSPTSRARSATATGRLETQPRTSAAVSTSPKLQKNRTTSMQFR